jgi:hypothetical protein
MEAYLEMGIVKEQKTGVNSIYIKMPNTDKNVFTSAEAKVVVMQLFRFIAEIDELNAELEPTETIQ